jgi:hypothetical protein
MREPVQSGPCEPLDVDRRVSPVLEWIEQAVRAARPVLDHEGPGSHLLRAEKGGRHLFA